MVTAASSLDHTFLCRWVSGEAKVNDEESSQVRWVDVSDPAERALLSERMLDRIDAALNYDGPLPFWFGVGAAGRVLDRLLGLRKSLRMRHVDTEGGATRRHGESPLPAFL